MFPCGVGTRLGVLVDMLMLVASPYLMLEQELRILPSLALHSMAMLIATSMVVVIVHMGPLEP
jgi:hypothetical protein